jgi:2-methylisocitrate lyase-like PEP mutase family enzyme
MTHSDKIQRFKSLHRPGDPLILLNAWDAGSAKVLHAAGAPAIATASWACAAAHGEADGEQLSLDLALANLERIIAAVEAPDLEPVRASFTEAGSARISTGPGAYRALMTAFGERAESLYRRTAQPA